MKGGLGPINAFSTLFGAILFSREKGKRERERETERERERREGKRERRSWGKFISSTRRLSPGQREQRTDQQTWVDVDQRST